jgi:hypothetical protein
VDRVGFPFAGGGILIAHRKGRRTMSTILILNAASSLVAAAGLGGLVEWRRRRAKRAVVRPLYVNSR